MAERVLTAGMLAAMAAGTVRPAIFYEGEFVTAGVTTYVRLVTAIGTLDWDGHTWTGGSDLLGISAIGESTDLGAIGFEVTMSGLPSSQISLALSSMKKNRPGRLWLGLFEQSGGADVLIEDPYPLRRGRFDIAVIARDGATCTIAAKYEDRLIDLERPREHRYTRESQKALHPTIVDTGFDQVEALQDTQFVWGR